MEIPNFDDRDLAIICLTVLGVAALIGYWINGQMNITQVARDVIVAVAGIATGKAAGGGSA